MQKYSDVVLSAAGTPVAGAVITVTTYPDGAAATIYGADGGASVASVTTDAGGYFSFYASNGRYSIAITGAGITPVSRNDIILYDPKDDRVSLKDFGPVGQGADDTALIQKAIDSGARSINARGLNLLVLGAVNLASNQTLDLTGTKITISGSSGLRFSAVTKTDWSIVGPFSITGDGSTVGTAIALYVSDCARWRIESPTISNVRGHGIYCDGGSNTTTRSDHGMIVSPKIKGCYRGYGDEPGTGGEYVTIENPHISECTDYGMKTAAGNIIVIGGHIVDNLQDGLVLAGGGTNHSHGGFHGTNINHNARYNLWTQQVTNGETFTGCHFYANDTAGNGSIFLDRSKGINISGGHLDCQIYNYKDGSSGLNVIENMFCPGGYGIARRTGSNDGHNELIIRGCFGAGAYAVTGGNDAVGVTINDPGLCYVYAEREAGTSQGLSSGVATTLTWTKELLDRRGAFNPATGVFTVPAAQAGMYAVKLDAVFNGTAMSATASYIIAIVNGTSRKFSFLTPYSTTKLGAQAVFDIYLAAGDTLAFQGAINGTSPSFGDSAVSAFMSINRIA